MPQNYQSVMCYLQSGLYLRLIVLAVIHSVGGNAVNLCCILGACLVVGTYAGDVFPSQSVQHYICPVVLTHFLHK